MLVELAGLHQERDDHAPAIEALRKATAEEPTLEEAHVALMRLLCPIGKARAGPRPIREAPRHPQKALGTQPAESRRRLREEIAAGRLQPSTAAGPAQEGLSEGHKHNLPDAEDQLRGA